MLAVLRLSQVVVILLPEERPLSKWGRPEERRRGDLLALENGHVEPVERAEPLALVLARAQSLLAPEPVAPLALGGLVRCVS